MNIEQLITGAKSAVENEIRKYFENVVPVVEQTAIADLRRALADVAGEIAQVQGRLDSLASGAAVVPQPAVASEAPAAPKSGDDDDSGDGAVSPATDVGSAVAPEVTGQPATS